MKKEQEAQKVPLSRQKPYQKPTLTKYAKPKKTIEAATGGSS